MCPLCTHHNAADQSLTEFILPRLHKKVKLQIGFSALADQIIYIEPYNLKVFNRSQGKYVKLKNNPVDKKGMPNDITYIEDCLCNGYILFQCKHDGLYVYELGSDRVTLVDEMSHGSYISAGYGKKHQIIYERCETNRPDKETPSHTASLYIYDCLTGEKRPFMNDKQWKEVYQKKRYLRK